MTPEEREQLRLARGAVWTAIKKAFWQDVRTMHRDPEFWELMALVGGSMIIGLLITYA